MKKTILLTSVGRRDYIIQYFKNLKDYDCRIIVCNSIENTTGMWLADKSYIAPSIKSNNYIPFLIDICKNEKVDILLSLYDLDTLYLSYYKKEFEKIGVFPLISNTNIILTCLDKIKTNQFLTGIGIKTPSIYTELNEVLNKLKTGKIQYPLVLKPQWGQGSIATEIVNNEDELIHGYYFLKSKIENSNILDVSGLNFSNILLFQEFILGDEYGVDVINNYKGHNKGVIIKKKLAMRSGETDAAISYHDVDIKKVCNFIGNKLQHIGMLDIDLIKQGKEIFIIDMNPRFGGGYPFSHQAGSNIPKALLQWNDGKKAENNCFEYNQGILTLKGISLVSKI